MNKEYDVIIIGGGPAGLSAGLYASRARLDTLLLEEQRKTGGQLTTYEEMENYPGVLKLSAPELMKNFRKHAEKFGTKIERGEVTEIDVDGFIKTIKTKNEEYRTKSIIIATGAKPRTLGIEGEKEFKGKGVSYCATCDADFFVDLEVVVVGNGNSAIEEAIYLTKFASKVTVIVIHKEGVMDADKILQERAYQNDKIEFIWNSTLEEIKGEGLVDTAVIKNIKTGEMTDFSCDGIFIFIGRVPRTDFIKGVVDLTEDNYIETDECLETSMPGVYAAGDVREKFLRQVVTAAADGATAASAAGGYIEEEEYWRKNVLEAKEDVLVTFWSPTNEASMELVNELEELDLSTWGVKLIKIDTYKNTRISNYYDINEIPTVLKIKQGEVVNKLISPKVTEIEKIL